MSTAREALDRPYAADHAASVASAMEGGKMPKSLPGLLRWYEMAWWEEIPDRLHKREVWADHPDRREQREGYKAVGGSLIGTHAYAESFRRYLENAASETDEDGYFTRPLHAAMAQMSREGRPLMARALFAVAQAGFDWGVIADRGGWAREMFGDYLHRALTLLWRDVHSERGLSVRLN